MKWNKQKKEEQEKQISKHFKAREFSCKCNYYSCSEQNLSDDLLVVLEKIREEFGKGIKITSGCRCLQHNAQEGGKTQSKHLFTKDIAGSAADIAPFDLKDIDTLYGICYKHVEALGKAKSFIHIDMRPALANGQKTLWTYK